MEIVIDIPEEIITDIKDYCGMSIADAKKALPIILNAIHNGTPLPKGHGRLKDENEVKQMIEDAKVENEYSKNFAENIIRFAPTIIEADKAESEEI